MCYYRYGIVEYFITTCPDELWQWSYSAKDFQEKIHTLAAGQPIQGVYVGLDGYLEAMHSSRNVIDLSYMGGETLLVLKHLVIEFDIMVAGMIRYRTFPRWELNMKKVRDYPPDDMVLSDKYYYDISNHDITHEFLDHTVKEVLVKGTDSWAFPQPEFDEDLAAAAAEKNDLPTEVDVFIG